MSAEEEQPVDIMVGSNPFQCSLENLKRQLAYYEKRHHKVFEYLKDLEPLKAFDH
jgi:hypothetical protein